MLDFCLTLAEKSHRELSRKIAAYEGSVDLIEVRLDCLDTPRLPELPLDSQTQFLATNRSRQQGGRYKGSEEDRLALLESAAENGFRWIDLENDVKCSVDFPQRAAVVRSYHSFQGFPKDLDSVLADLQSAGGDVFKIAVQVSNSIELKRLLLWMEGLPEQIPRIIIGMGAFGQPSRIIGRFLGNAWTYVSAGAEQTVAPGQFSLELARKVYRIDQWRTAPELFGIIGNPINQLTSVFIHNRLFEHYNREALFLPLQLDSIETWFKYMDATRLRFGGLAVAEPFETTIGRYLPGLGDTVDTLKRDGMNWIGLDTTSEGRSASESRELIVEQAARQFEIWTGIVPDRSLIKGRLDV